MASLLSDSIIEHKKLAEGTKAIKWIEESPFIFVYKNKNDFLKDSFTWDLRKKHGFNLIELEKDQLKNLLPGISNEYQFAIKIDGQGYISNSQNYLDDLISGFKDLGGEIIEDDSLIADNFTELTGSSSTHPLMLLCRISGRRLFPQPDPAHFLPRALRRQSLLPPPLT
mgnify:CR=1 FL=1